jgi:hypothetical protein
VTTRYSQPLPACLAHARTALLCFGVALLFAQSANAEAVNANSYYSWQWGGFTRSTPFVATSSSANSVSSLLLSSSYSTSSVAYQSPTALLSSAVTASTSTSSSNTATFSGVVYYDENQSGTRDSSDWGIRDATVSLIETNTNTEVTVVTDAAGNYSFTGLAAGDYTITLLTPSDQPEFATLGTITDASNNAVTSGLGTVSGTNQVTSVHLDLGSTAVNYDFPQSSYPTSLYSKRSLLNTSPGSYHTTDGPSPVPEPSTLVLLAIAGMSFTAFSRRRRPCAAE